MIDDGCDLDRWLRAGQMTSSGGGVMRRGHRITAPSLCVYGSLTAAAKTNSTAAMAECKSQVLRLSVRVCNMCSRNAARLFFFLEKKEQKRGRGFGDIYRPLSHPGPVGVGACVFMCLLVFIWLLGVRV